MPCAGCNGSAQSVPPPHTELTHVVLGMSGAHAPSRPTPAVQVALPTGVMLLAPVLPASSMVRAITHLGASSTPLLTPFSNLPEVVESALRMIPRVVLDEDGSTSVGLANIGHVDGASVLCSSPCVGYGYDSQQSEFIRGFTYTGPGSVILGSDAYSALVATLALACDNADAKAQRNAATACPEACQCDHIALAHVIVASYWEFQKRPLPGQPGFFTIGSVFHAACFARARGQCTPLGNGGRVG